MLQGNSGVNGGIVLRLDTSIDIICSALCYSKLLLCTWRTFGKLER